MLAHRLEGKRINVNVAAHLFEETSRRAHLLDNEMADRKNYFAVVSRQHAVVRRVAYGYGNQIKSRRHIIIYCVNLKRISGQSKTAAIRQQLKSVCNITKSYCRNPI